MVSDMSKTNEAVAGAREALNDNPLSPEALILLARASEQDGEKDRTSRLMILASRVTPRDLRSQLWLLDQDLRGARVDSALERIDVLLRGQLPDVVAAALPDPNARTLSLGLREAPSDESAVAAGLVHRPLKPRHRSLRVGLSVRGASSRGAWTYRKRADSLLDARQECSMRPMTPGFARSRPNTARKRISCYNAPQLRTCLSIGSSRQYLMLRPRSTPRMTREF